MQPRSSSALIGAIVLLPGLTSAATFTPLEIAAGGHNFRMRTAISADGSTVVSTGITQAVRWVDAGSPQFLGFMPGGDVSVPTGTSGDGSVVVGRGNALQGPGDPRPGEVNVQGFRWTATGGMQGLGYLPNGGNFASATAVSADGAVVVGYSDGPSAQRAVRWTEADGLQDLGFIQGGNGSSEAYGISADGAVIVGTSAGEVAGIFGSQAFRWDAAAGMTVLGPLAGSNSTVALAASADGTVIVGNSFTPSCNPCQPENLPSRNNAVRWIDEGPAMLLGQVPGGDQGSSALAVSGDGSVVAGLYFVNADDPITGFRAFVWTPATGMQTLLDVLLMQGAAGLSGWTLLQANGVSADGRSIAGYGINPDGAYQAFVARLDPVPLPAVGWTLGPALLMLARFRRRPNAARAAGRAR
jgi:probable HAF family extracellular repeat protein